MVVCSVISRELADYLNQLGFVGGNYSKVRQSIMHLIWYATVWEIWKERNSRIFNGKECSTYQIVDKIKSLSFLWLKAKLANHSFNYHVWWLSPFTMLTSVNVTSFSVFFFGFSFSVFVPLYICL